MTSSTGTSPMLRPSRSSAGTTWEASCSGDAPPNCGRPYEFTCEHTTDSFAGVSLANDEPLGITLRSSTWFFSYVPKLTMC